MYTKWWYKILLVDFAGTSYLVDGPERINEINK